MLCNYSAGYIYNWFCSYVYNLLIKIYLSLIFIKYLINKSRVKIKFLGQKCFTNEIIKLL